MTDIVQLSKDFLAAQVDELSGGQDPQAFQMVKSNDDTASICLVEIPQGDAERDLMADYLAAACCVHRAAETTFVSAAWSSMYSNIADTNIKPAQRGNRIEIAMLVHVTSQAVETYTAAILRVGGTVRLSPWINESAHDVNGGRIPESLRLGIKLAKSMPPEVIEALNQAKEAMPTGRILELFVEQIRRVRQEAQRFSAENN